MVLAGMPRVDQRGFRAALASWRSFCKTLAVWKDSNPADALLLIPAIVPTARRAANPCKQRLFEAVQLCAVGEL